MDEEDRQDKKGRQPSTSHIPALREPLILQARILSILRGRKDRINLCGLVHVLFCLYLLRALRVLCGGILLIAGVPSTLSAIGAADRFTVAQLVYTGGNWDPYPGAITGLMTALVSRTSTDASLERVEISLKDPQLYHFPLLYMAGDQSFPPFAEADARVLRNYLDSGGMLFIDDALGVEDEGFHASIKRLVDELYPGRKLEPLAEDHAVYVTFHLLKRFEGGRRLVKANLYGVPGDERTPILYSFNDLGGAWARDHLGNFIYPCFPGGEYQREMAFRAGINVILYALTLDYKKDLIHQPYILRRQK